EVLPVPGVILLVVTIHDAVALAIGYSTAVLGGMGTRERKALTFEVGIRNAGLGLGLVFAFFGGLGGMAIVAGWWGIWDIVAGLILAGLWSRHTARKTGSSKGDATHHAAAPA
ncbi:MAG: bile acid:sodium symporter family protein, partial [Microbacterium sp.]